MTTPRRLFTFLVILLLNISVVAAHHNPGHAGGPPPTPTILTPATGGTAIPVSTAGGAYTALTGPVVAEVNSHSEIGVGTIILQAPSGFEFDGTASVTVLVTRTGGSGPSTRNINDVASGTSLAASVTASQVTFTITDATSNNVKNSLTFQGITVRPSSAVITFGEITHVGTSSIDGVASNTSFGTLATVDDVDPVITVLGDDPVTLTVGDSYVDDGATASDNIDGDITASLLTTSDVDTSIAGSYTVEYNVTDAAGNTAFASRTVDVNDAPNIPPSAAFTFDPTGPFESDSVSFDASGSSDSDGSIVSYDWDFGDGASDSGAGVSHAYADDGVYTVTLTVTDDDGLTDSTSQDVTVSNADPAVSAGEDQSTMEGAELSFTLATYTDAGADDAHEATIDWDDGTMETFPVSGGVVSGTHTYADEGAGLHIVSITVDDDDGGSDSTSVLVTVDNAAPDVDAGEDWVISEGDTVSLGSGFGDAGVDDFHDALVDWGDGTVESGAVSEAGGTGSVFGVHVYPDDGIFTVTVTVSDNDGAETPDSFTVFVSNTDPFVTTSDDQEVDEGDLVSIDPTDFYDTDADTHEATIDWGDGTVESGFVDEEAGTVEATHVYDMPGDYEVSVTVTDDDGGSGIGGFEVFVYDITPPEITLLGEASVTLTVGDPYEDAGATALDEYEGDLTESISTVNPVDTGAPGVYTVTYDVTDDSGNAATQVTRTVTVEEAPVPPPEGGGGDEPPADSPILDNNDPTTPFSFPGNDLSGLDNNLLSALAAGLAGYTGPGTPGTGGSSGEVPATGSSSASTPPVSAGSGLGGITGAVVGVGEGSNNWYGLISLLLLLGAGILWVQSRRRS